MQIKLMNLWRAILHEAGLQRGISSKNRCATRAKGLHAHHSKREPNQGRPSMVESCLCQPSEGEASPGSLADASWFLRKQSVFHTMAREVKAVPRGQGTQSLRSNDTDVEGRLGDSSSGMGFLFHGDRS